MSTVTDKPWWRRLLSWAWDLFRRARAWAWLRLPPGMRLVVGGLAIIAGIIGIVVPGIGPWLIPVGIGIAMVDIKWIKCRLRAAQNEAQAEVVPVEVVNDEW